MDIINKLYPYPVLWENNDDYIKSSFDCDIDINKNFDVITINAKFKLKNKQINKLIEDGKAEYVIHIESSSTLYREIKCSNQKEFSFDILSEHLWGAVSLSSFIVVKEKIIDYYNCDFNLDYEGTAFNLDIGNILAIGPQYKFDVEKNAEELANISSIFTIYRREDDDNIDLKVDMLSDKIKIGLSRDVYENYNHIAKLQVAMLNMLNTAILLPTLVYVLEQLKDDISAYEECRWFQAMKRFFKNENMNLDEDMIESNMSIVLAQKIMHMPIAKTLILIKDIDKNIEEE